MTDKQIAMTLALVFVLYLAMPLHMGMWGFIQARVEVHRAAQLVQVLGSPEAALRYEEAQRP